MESEKKEETPAKPEEDKKAPESASTEEEKKSEGPKTEVNKREELKNQFYQTLQQMSIDPNTSRSEFRKLRNLAPLFDEHTYWKGQPVPQITDESENVKEGPIEKKTVD